MQTTDIRPFEHSVGSGLLTATANRVNQAKSNQIRPKIFFWDAVSSTFLGELYGPCRRRVSHLTAGSPRPRRTDFFPAPLFVLDPVPQPAKENLANTK